MRGTESRSDEQRHRDYCPVRSPTWAWYRALCNNVCRASCLDLVEAFDLLSDRLPDPDAAIMAFTESLLPESTSNRLNSRRFRVPAFAPCPVFSPDASADSSLSSNDTPSTSVARVGFFCAGANCTASTTAKHTVYDE